uniref:Uncharacterized protein n=1 Tax=Megaselia scalaris TaxID=36166 RepID=T1H2R3_MEGSC
MMIALAEQKEKESKENPLTINDLEEKLAQAEIRRQAYIQNRIDSIATISYNKPKEVEAKNSGNVKEEEEEEEEGGRNLGDSKTVVKDIEEDDVIINK